MRRTDPFASLQSDMTNADEKTGGLDSQAHGATANRVPRAAWLALVLMALLASSFLVIDVRKYTQAIGGAQGLRLSIISIRVMDDENPRAIVQFRVRNDAPVGVLLVRYGFELDRNGQRVGSSYSTYVGTDGSMDASTYRDAAVIDRELAPGKSLDLEFTLFVYPPIMDGITQAQPSGSPEWKADTELITVLPYSRDESRIRLRAGLEE